MEMALPNLLCHTISNGQRFYAYQVAQQTDASASFVIGGSRAATDNASLVRTKLSLDQCHVTALSERRELNFAVGDCRYNRSTKFV